MQNYWQMELCLRQLEIIFVYIFWLIITIISRGGKGRLSEQNKQISVLYFHFFLHCQIKTQVKE